MTIVIPADWFMGDEHPMSKIAWHLYEHVDTVDNEFMDELINLMKEFESAQILTLKDHKPRVAAVPIGEQELVRLRSLAEPRVLAILQKQELERRKKAKETVAPLLALADGDVDKPLPTSLYDFNHDHESITRLMNIEVNKIRNEEKLAEEQKAKRVRKKPKSSKPAKATGSKTVKKKKKKAVS